MKYQITFEGRESGAIGKFYSITETYTADSQEKAIALCFADGRTEKNHIYKVIEDNDCE